MTDMIKTELLAVADTVARDKAIDREEVLEAMEEAIQKVAKTKYGLELEIHASIHRQTGEISLFRIQEVVEDVHNSDTEISLEDVHLKDKSLKVGDFYKQSLPPIDFGRVAAQTAKQVIFQRVRDAERLRQYREFKDRVGEIISGVVKRVDYGNLTLDLGRAEAVLRREDLIPRESFRMGDRVRAYIADVRQEPRGPQIFLSRTHPQFMAKLFMQEVPEIYDGIIEVKAVARDPGSRAKMGVYTKEGSIDPVGSCVGMRGSRVQAVVSELQGEKVDIILWSADPATFIVNALAPAEISKVLVDEETHRIEVAVPSDQLSLAIGRRGQNVRLASQVTGWNIDIITEEQESERRTEDMKQRSSLFVEALGVDEMMAHLLINEGFSNMEEVAYVDPEEFYSIEGFDEDLVKELQTRATSYLAERDRLCLEKARDLGVSEDLLTLEGITPSMAAIFGEKDVKTLDDFADLSGEEVLEFLPAGTLSLEDANDLIMKARAHWFNEQ